MKDIIKNLEKGIEHGKDWELNLYHVNIEYPLTQKEYMKIISSVKNGEYKGTLTTFNNQKVIWNIEFRNKTNESMKKTLCTKFKEFIKENYTDKKEDLFDEIASKIENGYYYGYHPDFKLNIEIFDDNDINYELNDSDYIYIASKIRDGVAQGELIISDRYDDSIQYNGWWKLDYNDDLIYESKKYEDNIKKGELVYDENAGKNGLIGLVISDSYYDEDMEDLVFDVYFRGYDGEVIPSLPSELVKIDEDNFNMTEENKDYIYYRKLAKKKGFFLNPSYEDYFNKEEYFDDVEELDESKKTLSVAEEKKRKLQ